MVEFTVVLGETVRKGDVLARIWDTRNTGRAPIEIQAKMEGLFAARHQPGLTQIGDCLAVLAIEHT